ncbi:WcbI family polysaccharide biosynthesis putative acetyltransferase [Pseudonocardia bannensis]|uniref:Polysaccharide biosynthesis enzyme WcbI domain-containing protein n=1 Tax=Pseudonocardia bannensis TaxID=630973 RepID=A0A848DIK5_9PSEU|nr:WcbI family polysaccharide biosynthesis putative acetyltransferase [Pseudonocardia bannensis]NMH92284.1 hypothetical protein [Pseudonocardia bannensis]
MDAGRRAHYGEFYDGPGPTDRPLAVVHGNCQAESMRVLLAGSPTFSCPTVRVPRVQEPRADWLVDGTAVPAELVRAAQLDRYAAHPEWITAGLRRLADRRVLLGLRP